MNIHFGVEDQDIVLNNKQKSNFFQPEDLINMKVNYTFLIVHNSYNKSIEINV